MSERLGPEVLALARDGDPVALARVLVATPSVNPSLARDGAGEGLVAEVAADFLSGWGLDPELVEAMPGRPNLVAHLDGEGPALLLNGHLDTVGVEGMSVAPFGAVLDGERLVGRGSCDMKGGVASLLAAAARLARRGPRPPLVIALTADEEHASVGMARLAEDLPRGGFAIVCEPTSLTVMPAHKGFIWIRAAFRGRAAHGSRPDLGIDAIRHAGLFLAALDGYIGALSELPAHALLGHGSLHSGTIRGGTAESVYPDRCELLLERRTLPGEHPADTMSGLEGILRDLNEREPDLDADLEITLARPGTEVPEDSEDVRRLLDAAEAHGLRRTLRGMTAWVDAAFLNEAGIPAVCFGPGSIDQAHTSDEWIDVRQIRTCADVIETFARARSSEA